MLYHALVENKSKNVNRHNRSYRTTLNAENLDSSSHITSTRLTVK